MPRRFVMRLTHACLAVAVCLFCVKCTTTTEEFAVVFDDAQVSRQVGGTVFITPVSVGPVTALMQNGTWQSVGGCGCTIDDRTLHGTTLGQNPDSRTTLLLICDDTHINIYVGLGLMFE